MPEINNLNMDDLLLYTAQAKATDLHISVAAPPMIRCNAKLIPIENTVPVTQDMARALMESCTSPSKRETLEQMGEVDFSFSRPGLGRFRANIFKQRGSFSIAIRSLPFTIPSFDDLGIPKSVYPLTERKSGLILATGATGSGKSTTLAAMVDIINSKRNCHIITIEDPIEYLHRHKTGIVNQREIGSDTHSFSNALRAALREDPDVILVGEMRDMVTIDIALTAAETGHLVFSTLHTMGAAKTVNRILDAFPHDQQTQVRSQLAAVLEGVISQQLLPKADGNGLSLACEVMLVNNAIRNLIREGKPHQINTILQTSNDSGMQAMDSALADLCNRNVVSYDDARNRAQDLQIFQQLCMRKW